MKRLFVTSGTGERFTGICVYFIRIKTDITISVKNVAEVSELVEFNTTAPNTLTILSAIGLYPSEQYFKLRQMDIIRICGTFTPLELAACRFTAEASGSLLHKPLAELSL